LARAPSLAKLAARRVGPVKGGRAIAFMWQWALWRETTGAPPASITQDVTDYADWWRESERTVWRHLELYREAFPGEQTPDRILDLVLAQIDRSAGVRGLGRVVPPASSVAA
jgi:hypothetical protein